MKVQSTRVSAFGAAFALGLVIFGCGGGGALGGSDNVKLSASQASIPYGATVTIGWTTRNLKTTSNNGFEKANFVRIYDSLPPNGNVTDQPAMTTTYRMAVRSDSGSLKEDAITVHVAKSAKKFLVVGGTTSPDQATAQTLLSEVTSVPSTLSSTIPAPSADFDVLILCEGGAFGPADRSTVANWVVGGKGVVVVGGAGNQLATGSLSNSNTSSIATWFGGVTSCTRTTNQLEARFQALEAENGIQRTNRDWSNPNRTIGRLITWTSWYKIDSMSASANAQSVENLGTTAPGIASWQFETGTARVYFIASLQGPTVTSNYEDAQIREVFLPGVRWAARG